MMAYESDNPVGFCFKFAHSTDLAAWDKLDVPAFAGLGGGEYSACPVIRYNGDDGRYYVIYLAVGKGAYAGQYVSNIIRSRDLVNWEFSEENPVLAPAAGEGINNSDVDLFEHDGKTYVYYANGDQATWLQLRHAVYDGSTSEFLWSYFPSPIAGDANDDGVVDDEDASILGAHWLRSGTGIGWAQGDFNRDGEVNDADAAILAAHWQTTRETGPDVPEPSTAVLLIAGGAVLVWRRRNKILG
jgi:beta-xylosidase